MGQKYVPSDRAVHSDYLIHWTGLDIDACPFADDRGGPSKTTSEETKHYLSRLRDILRYGLWLTEDGPEFFRVDDTDVPVPPVPRLCFTELKLSESRRHAGRYGRLGIGVKRPFLFHRFGRPMSYFGFSGERHKDRFLEACATDLKDPRFMAFFKPMNEEYSHLSYAFYAESEWRMIYFSELEAEGKIVDPRKQGNTDAYAYFGTLSPQQQDKLKYLVPLDGWLSMIIYPSVEVKNLAIWDDDAGIRAEIKRIKSDANDHGNRVEGLKQPTRGNWPIEVDLDACAHF